MRPNGHGAHCTFVFTLENNYNKHIKRPGTAIFPTRLSLRNGSGELALDNQNGGHGCI